MGKQANPIGFGEAVRGECMRGEEKERKRGNAFPAGTFLTQNRPLN